jgi:hypothetical protein
VLNEMIGSSRLGPVWRVTRSTGGYKPIRPVRRSPWILLLRSLVRYAILQRSYNGHVGADSRYRKIEGEIMTYDVAQLLKMTQPELDDLFKTSPEGPIPNGQADGTAIIAPGTANSVQIATFINHFAWQGKVFDAKAGYLKNRILAFGLDAIVAKVYKAASWLDGKPCIVLDYSETSLVAHWIRDEIRLIGPQFYLGIVYSDRDRLINFSLKF